MGLKIAVIGMGLLVGLIVSEAVLRLFRLAPTEGVSTVNQSEFLRLPGIFAPDRSVIDRRIPALAHRVTIDSLGFRGIAVARAKPADELRILFIGDSFTYGDFVNDQETLPIQVEAALQPLCRKRVRSVNAGLGGSTITDQAHMIERALPLRPDIIVLVFSENDVDDLRGRPLWDRLAENRARKSRFPFSLAYPVLRGTALWNLGLKASAVRRRRANAVTRDQDNRQPHARVPVKLRARYRDHLLAVRADLAARGIPLVFAVFPSYFSLRNHTVDSRPTDANAPWAARMAASEGFVTTDFLPTFDATGLTKEQLYLLPHDGHPSARAYALAGDVLTKAIAAFEPFQASCR